MRSRLSFIDSLLVVALISIVWVSKSTRKQTGFDELLNLINWKHVQETREQDYKVCGVFKYTVTLLEYHLSQMFWIYWTSWCADGPIHAIIGCILFLHMKVHNINISNNYQFFLVLWEKCSYWQNSHWIDVLCQHIFAWIKFVVSKLYLLTKHKIGLYN